MLSRKAKSGILQSGSRGGIKMKEAPSHEAVPSPMVTEVISLYE